MNHLKTFICTIGAAIVTSLAPASTLVLNSNPYSDSYGGGEFTANLSGLNLSSYSTKALVSINHNLGFETFCMEYGEEFVPGHTYSYTLSNSATGGDLPAGFDPLSKGTAWLYAQFSTGNLAGYSYALNSTRNASALQLQLAFWYLEDETNPAYTTFAADHPGFNPSTNAFISAACAQFGGLAGAKADANGAFGVSVLNLTSGSHDQYKNQSQLYYHIVPESGSTLALVAFAALSLIGLRRRVD
ncbi:MAG: protein sorting protein [Verrucomicrobia bacterium]|nr:protein sorting protein [Verrucomicrobiota bacterium]